jgi:cyclophilin family peptidyl-prolyl cis-trans isomerase
MRRLFTILLLCLPGLGLAQPDNRMVVFHTNLGDIELELYEDKAPKTVANFLAYVENGFYDGTVFHRVIQGFVIQGGGFDQSLRKKPTREPIENEADNGLGNKRGTLSMARTGAPDSATSQFFINLTDNQPLDYSDDNPGYAVFARVVDGIDVVYQIATLPTGPAGPFQQDVPQRAVMIESAEVVTQTE